MSTAIILKSRVENESAAEQEIWRPVPGEEWYEVSNMGRVRGTKRSRWGGRCVPRVMKPDVGRDGYSRVRLYPKNKKFFVHVLVLRAFVGPSLPGQECRHFPDRCRTNNRLSNLQWGTRIENNADKAVHGTAAKGDKHGRRTKPERSARGTKINTVKLTENDVHDIRRALAAGSSQRSLARKYGVSQSPIYLLKHGLSWRHITTTGL